MNRQVNGSWYGDWRSPTAKTINYSPQAESFSGGTALGSAGRLTRHLRHMFETRMEPVILTIGDQRQHHHLFTATLITPYTTSIFPSQKLLSLFYMCLFRK